MRWNGSVTRISSSSGIPGPSSSIAISTACAVEPIVARARLPYLTALSIRLASARFNRSRLAFADNRLRRLHGDRKPGMGHVIDDAGEQCRKTAGWRACSCSVPLRSLTKSVEPGPRQPLPRNSSRRPGRAAWLRLLPRHHALRARAADGSPTDLVGVACRQRSRPAASSRCSPPASRTRWMAGSLAATVLEARFVWFAGGVASVRRPRLRWVTPVEALRLAPSGWCTSLPCCSSRRSPLCCTAGPPRSGKAVWVVLAVVFVLDYLGGPCSTYPVAVSSSPFARTSPRSRSRPGRGAPAVVALLCVALTTWGVAGFRRRDIG